METTQQKPQTISKAIKESIAQSFHLREHNILVICDTHGSLIKPELLSETIPFAQPPEAIFLLGDVLYSDLCLIKSVFPDVPKFGVPGDHDDLALLEQFGVTNVHNKIVNWNDITVGGYGGSIRYRQDAPYLMHTQEEAMQELSTLCTCDILLTHASPYFAEEQERERRREEDRQKKEARKNSKGRKILFKLFPEVFPQFNPNGGQNNFPNSYGSRLLKKLGATANAAKYQYQAKRATVQENIVNPHAGLKGIMQYITEKQPQYVLFGHNHWKVQKRFGKTTVFGCYRVQNTMKM